MLPCDGTDCGRELPSAHAGRLSLVGHREDQQHGLDEQYMRRFLLVLGSRILDVNAHASVRSRQELRCDRAVMRYDIPVSSSCHPFGCVQVGFRFLIPADTSYPYRLVGYFTSGKAVID